MVLKLSKIPYEDALNMTGKEILHPTSPVLDLTLQLT